MIRMLIVGYCFGVRSERRLCEEVHLNLAYRWFCRLGLDGAVPDHSTFSKNRHGRFRESDLLRRLFESVLQRCIARVWSVAKALLSTPAWSRPTPAIAAAPQALRVCRRKRRDALSRNISPSSTMRRSVLQAR